MKIRFLAEADAEFRESARYYEAKAQGLGIAFITEVHRATAIVASQPSIGSPVDDELGLRKFVLRRFSYNLIYSIEGDGVVIIAVAHHKRRPFYWGRRE